MRRLQRISGIDAGAQPVAGGWRIVAGLTVSLALAGVGIVHAASSDERGERHAEPDAQAQQADADDKDTDSKAVGERLEAAGRRIKAAIADGEMTEDEALTAWHEARDEIIATAVDAGEISEEAAAVYRGEVRKVELGERLEEASDKLKAAVASGDMTEEQSWVEWNKTKDELITRAVDEGEVSQEDATTLRRDIHKGELGERLGAAGKEIREAIVKGEITKDEGWTQWYTAKEKLITAAVANGEVSEQDAAVFRKDIHKAELGIRLREAGGKIRAAIGGGEMTEDEGWAEWHVVKEKLITTAVDGGEVSEADAAVFRRGIERAEAGQKLKRAVAKSEMTEEEAWAKWDEINDEADKEKPEGDTKGRLESLGKKLWSAGQLIKGAVAKHELTDEAAAAKWNETKERIIKEAVKAGKITKEEAGIMRREVEKAEAAEKLRAAVAKGEMTEKEALAKWAEIKKKADTEDRRKRAIKKMQQENERARPGAEAKAGQAPASTPKQKAAAVARSTNEAVAKRAAKLHPWEKYVREFNLQHMLTKPQRAAAMSILKDVRKRAIQIEQTNAKKVVEANKIKDEAARKARLKALNKPIDRLFDELKKRLEGLLTASQRAMGAA